MKIVIEKNKEPRYTQEEYLNLPDVKAADDAEKRVHPNAKLTLKLRARK